MTHAGSSSGQRRGAVSGIASVLGSSASGVAEVAIFHPIDTVAKRLMYNTKKVFDPARPMAENLGVLRGIVFRDAAAASFAGKLRSLFPGLTYGAVYKILQRTYKYSGQPFVAAGLDKLVPELQGGNGSAKAHWTRVAFKEACAGAIIGVGEVILLPLDIMKIKSQTNMAAVQQTSFLGVMRRDPRALFRGAGWTAARNGPGTFAMFGGATVVKAGWFGVEDMAHATVYQNFVASIVGAVAAVTIASPLDVIKTRVQATDFDKPRSGFEVARTLLREEGVSGFFKGLVPKLSISGPKIIFSFTLASSLMPRLDAMMYGSKANAGK